MLVILSLCISAMLSSRSMLATVMWVHLLACRACVAGRVHVRLQLGRCARMDDLLCTVAFADRNVSDSSTARSLA